MGKNIIWDGPLVTLVAIACFVTGAVSLPLVDKLFFGEEKNISTEFNEKTVSECFPKDQAKQILMRNTTSIPSLSLR